MSATVEKLIVEINSLSREERIEILEYLRSLRNKNADTESNRSRVEFERD